MSKTVITAIYYAVIVGLFYLDRRPRERTGAGLWVAFAWLFFVFSKSPAAWMQSGQTISYDGGYNLESNPINLVVYAVIILSGVIVLGARRNQLESVYELIGRSCCFTVTVGLVALVRVPSKSLQEMGQMPGRSDHNPDHPHGD